MLHVPQDYSFQLPSISSSLHVRHPSEAIKQARKIKESFNINDFLEGRRQTTWITIDSLSSPDLDDGIHVEKLPDNKGYRLLVSIASPTELIPPGSPIDNEAMERATSVYFWEGHIHHMLPNIISTDIASLNHQKHSLTLTLELEINQDFEVIKRDMYPSIFYNRQRHNPESFTNWISHTSSSEYEYFSIMHELARWLFSRRDSKHRIDRFDDSDRRIVQWEKIYGHNNDHISSFIIQEFMILANRETAKLMSEEWVNGIYRTHMPEYADGRELPRILERAHYSPELWFHTWLWIPEYMHSTSPIRRLADYISQRQLICLLGWNWELYSPEQVKQICKYINLQVIAILWHQKDELQDMKGKRIMRKHKKTGDTKMTPVIEHIKHRQENWLRIPNSIREEIIQRIETQVSLETWIIERFILSKNEKEIREALRKRILADTKVRRYISVLEGIENIDYKERIIIRDGRFYFEVRAQVLGKAFSSISVWWNVRPIQHWIFDPSNSKEILIYSDQRWVYSLSRRDLAAAKYKVLKRTLEKTFNAII